MAHFAKYVDEEKEQLTYVRIQQQIEYLRSNPEMYKDINDDAYFFLYIDTNLGSKQKI